MNVTTFGELEVGERFFWHDAEWRKVANREARAVCGFRVEMMHEEMTVWKRRR